MFVIGFGKEGYQNALERAGFGREDIDIEGKKIPKDEQRTSAGKTARVTRAV